MQRIRALVVVGALAGITIGCGKSPESRFASNATGIVTVGGVPTAGIYVYLHKVGDVGSASIGAKTNAGGEFSVAVSTPGEYVVTITWPKVTLDHGEEIEGDDRFQGRHALLDSPVLKATIREGDNPLPPINLKRS